MICQNIPKEFSFSPPLFPPLLVQRTPRANRLRGEKRLDLRYRAMEKLGWMAESRVVPRPGEAGRGWVRQTGDGL